jgi:hypothetical protein
VKTSPAPSQSDEVIRGGWVCTKSRLVKKRVRKAMVSERSRRRAELKGVLARKCGIVRRYSLVWYFFWSGKVWIGVGKDVLVGLRRG